MGELDDMELRGGILMKEVKEEKKWGSTIYHRAHIFPGGQKQSLCKKAYFSGSPDELSTKPEKGHDICEGCVTTEVDDG